MMVGVARSIMSITVDSSICVCVRDYKLYDQFTLPSPDLT